MTDTACKGALGWSYVMSIFLGCVALRAAESPPTMIIVQPGYPGSTDLAGPFMKKLTDYLGDRAGLEGLDGVYHNKEKDALEAIATKKPGFGVVSLPFYLEYRKRFQMKAFLRVKPGDNFVVVVGEGTVEKPSELAGEVVTGGPLHEAAFLERIAFRGKAEVASWKQRPTTLGIRAARNLVRALERDRKPTSSAVVMTGREYRTLQELPYAKSLEKILESDYYPPAVVVAFHAWPAPAGEEASPAATEKKEEQDVDRVEEAPQTASRALADGAVESVVRAFSKLSEDPEGKEILEEMGAEGFEKIPADWLKDLERRYDVESEEK